MNVSQHFHFDLLVTNNQQDLCRILVHTWLRGNLIGQNYLRGESQGISPKIPDHPFRGHFVSGSGGLGTRLVCIHTDRHNDTFSMPASCHALRVCPGAPFVLLGAGLAPLWGAIPREPSTRRPYASASGVDQVALNKCRSATQWGDQYVGCPPGLLDRGEIAAGLSSICRCCTVQIWFTRHAFLYFFNIKKIGTIGNVPWGRPLLEWSQGSGGGTCFELVMRLHESNDLPKGQ